MSHWVKLSTHLLHQQEIATTGVTAGVFDSEGEAWETFFSEKKSKNQKRKQKAVDSQTLTWWCPQASIRVLDDKSRYFHLIKMFILQLNNGAGGTKDTVFITKFPFIFFMVSATLTNLMKTVFIEQFCTNNSVLCTCLVYKNFVRFGWTQSTPGGRKLSEEVLGSPVPSPWMRGLGGYLRLVDFPIWGRVAGWLNVLHEWEYFDSYLYVRSTYSSVVKTTVNCLYRNTRP